MLKRRVSSGCRFESMESRQLLSAAGQLDTSFGGTGQVKAGFSLAADSGGGQSDGKTLVVGWTRADGFDVIRLNVDGSMDTSFGSNGAATVATAGSAKLLDRGLPKVAIEPDGKIVVAGVTSQGIGTGMGTWTVVRFGA